MGDGLDDLSGFSNLNDSILRSCQIQPFCDSVKYRHLRSLASIQVRRCPTKKQSAMQAVISRALHWVGFFSKISSI